MVNLPLKQLLPDEQISRRDHVQLALAIGHESTLRSLLTESWPRVVFPHEIGSIRAQVGLPTQTDASPIDGVIQFERIVCRLAGSRPGVPLSPEVCGHNHYQALTRCVSNLHTLALNQPFGKVMGLLAEADFAPDHIEQILNLPYQAWHKSWWYQVDAVSRWSPFQRFIHSRRYGDGTATVQYKDYYAQDAPGYFLSYKVRLAVIVREADEGFVDTLLRINQARQALGVEQALLIVDSIFPEEAEGFAGQGVSLYTSQELAAVQRADCYRCLRDGCPLKGHIRSPVLICQDFTQG